MSQLRPFSALNDLHRELNRVFDPANNRDLIAHTASANTWTPHVDIKENDDNYTVFADIPGVKPEEVEVTLHNDVLTIRGERDSEITRKKDNFKRQERFHGTFFRQFSLPELTDDAAIEAKANHGVLEITIPKAKRERPISITVTEK